jgi:hypothetical protein
MKKMINKEENMNMMIKDLTVEDLEQQEYVAQLNDFLKCLSIEKYSNLSVEIGNGSETKFVAKFGKPAK